MSARPLRPAIAAVAALVLTIGLVAGCSRKPAPDASEDAATETTAGTGTSVAPPPTDSSTSSTVSGSIDPNASSTTLAGDDLDAFGHTPQEVQAFRTAYSQAFDAECRRIWASVGGGLLSDPDFPEDAYRVDDCLSEVDPDFGELVDSVEEARTTGADDAQIAASDLADPLCAADGVTCWSYGD